MEKISGILPSSSRITSVDTKGNLPTRPGAPSFGQEEGRSPVRDRFTVSGEAGSRVFSDASDYRKMKDTRQAKMVEDITRNFFAKPQQDSKDPTINTSMAQERPELENTEIV